MDSAIQRVPIGRGTSLHQLQAALRQGYTVRDSQDAVVTFASEEELLREVAHGKPLYLLRV